MLKKKDYRTQCVGKWHLGHLPPYLPTGNDRMREISAAVQEGAGDAIVRDFHPLPL